MLRKRENKWEAKENDSKKRELYDGFNISRKMEGDEHENKNREIKRMERKVNEEAWKREIT